MTKKQLNNTIRIAASLLLLYFVYRFYDLEFDELTSAISVSDKGYLFTAVGMMFLTLSIQVGKWHYLINMHEHPVSKMEALKSLLAGMTLGIITPARIGEVGRAIFLSNVDRLAAVGLTLIDKLYSTVAYLIMGSIGLLLYVTLLANVFDTGLLIPVISLSIALVIAFIAISNPTTFGRLISFVSKITPWKTSMKKIAESTELISSKRAAITTLLGALAWTSVITQFCFFVRALSPIAVKDGLITASTAHFVKTLFPLTFGELGVREASAIYFFGNIGVSQTAAFSAALLMFVTNVLSPALIGVIFLYKLKISGNNELEKN